MSSTGPVDFELHESTFVVRIGKHAHADSMELLSNNLWQSFRKSGAKNVVVDFTDVAHCTSNAIGVLLQIRGDVMAGGGRFAICCLGIHMREKLDALHLHTVFTVRDTVQDACDAMVD